MGIGEVYTEGRNEKDWVEYCLGVWRSIRFPNLPTLDEFLNNNLGAWSNPITNPSIAFEDFRRDPEKHPLNTPSGKVEIFSKQLYDLNDPSKIPPIPKYIQEWESPFETIQDVVPVMEGRNESIVDKPSNQRRYPLQAIGHHTLARVHSTHANNNILKDAFPQHIFINPIDASNRSIHNGDLVRVWNDRGELVISARVTPLILPGVVDIPQGAWWNPGETGTDLGGCINVLTSERWTPYAFGTAQHTIMVQVTKLDREDMLKISKL